MAGAAVHRQHRAQHARPGRAPGEEQRQAGALPGLGNKDATAVRRACTVAALAVAVFIVVGSLVPFDLRAPESLFFAPVTWVQRLPVTPLWPADLLANMAVGAALGFFLGGTLRPRGRTTPGATLLVMLVVAGAGSLLALVVELLQVLSVTRQESWNDVVAQSLGGAIGAALWVIGGGHGITVTRGAMQAIGARLAARGLS
jgi:hypothetical protein